MECNPGKIAKIETSSSHTSPSGSLSLSSSFTESASPTESSNQKDFGLRDSKYETEVQQPQQNGHPYDSDKNQPKEGVRSRRHFYLDID